MSKRSHDAGERRSAQTFRGASFRAAIPYAVALGLLAVAVVVLGREFDRHVAAVEAWNATLGPWGIVGFIVLYVAATTVLVPESLLSIMAGALFGLGEGLAAAFAAGVISAVLQFFLARGLLRARVRSLFAARPTLARIHDAVTRSGLRLQFLLRLTPLSPTTLSYVFGAAGVKFSGFLVSCLALLPTQLIEVYFGYAGRHVASMAGRGSSGVHLHDAAVIGGLTACIVAMAVVSRMARNAVKRAVPGGSRSDS